MLNLHRGDITTGRRAVPNYMADPDIRGVLESRFDLSGLDAAEVERLEEFLRCDQVLERFYRQSSPTERPPEAMLLAAADSAMAAYDQRSERLSRGWQKFLVLQAGIAGSPDNLDSSEVQEWAYVRIKEEHPEWLGDFDEDVDREMPLRWLIQLIGVGVLMRRRIMEEPAPQLKRRGLFRRR
jgi:hypothetical protein